MIVSGSHMSIPESCKKTMHVLTSKGAHSESNGMFTGVVSKVHHSGRFLIDIGGSNKESVSLWLDAKILCA